MARSAVWLIAALLVACRDAGGEVGPPPEPASSGASLASSADASLAPPPTPRHGPPREVLAARLGEVGEWTVRIEGTSEHANTFGSAVLVTADGRAVTAHHVVADRTAKLTAVLPSGERVDVLVLARDEPRDLAALRLVGAKTAHWVEPGAVPRRGEWVVCGGIPGSPKDGVPTRTTGTLLDAAHLFEPVTYSRTGEPTKTGRFTSTLAVDCGVASGMSGGPLIDVSGRLVGVMIGVGVAAPLEPTSEVMRALELRPPAAPPALSEAAPAPRARFEQLDRDRKLDAVHAATVALVTPEHLSAAAVALGPNALLVAPAQVLFDPHGSPETARAAGLSIPEVPGARCETIALRGELALLRCSELTLPGLALGGVARPVLADEVYSVEPGTQPTGVGFVTDTKRAPGTITPRELGFGCGTLRAHHRAMHPAVTVGEVFAHDADRFLPGALVVDAAGTPLGIDVASVDTGINYAVAMSEVLARFPELAR